MNYNAMGIRPCSLIFLTKIPCSSSILISLFYQEIAALEINEPDGWIDIPLLLKDEPVRTFLVQLAVLANHQNGRDTHIRLVNILAPQA